MICLSAIECSTGYSVGYIEYLTAKRSSTNERYNLKNCPSSKLLSFVVEPILQFVYLQKTCRARET